MRAGGSSIYMFAGLLAARFLVHFSVLSFSISQHRRKATRTEI